jgi:homoserine O-succinyltransferase
VTYWDELRRIFDWSQVNVHRTLNVCWGAMAALHHFHGVPKHGLASKASGVFRHDNRAPASPWMRGLPDVFDVPVSRWSEVRATDLPEGRGLRVLADSAETGLCLIDDPAHRALHMFNHLEYDTLTLAGEYARDEGGYMPQHYFPATIRRPRPPTPGAATGTCSTATGSTRPTRPRRSIWRTWAGAEGAQEGVKG